jgi:predicted pyridoxine 5'-phosphate oxidase superfamily flavin-nucleotide-binding protein
MTLKTIITAATLAAAILPVAAIHTAAAEPTKPSVVRSGYVEQLTPENSFLVLVDLQDMFGLTIGSIDQTALINNAVGVAKAAKVFNVPTVLATANARTFAGPFFAQVTEARNELAGVRPNGH